MSADHPLVVVDTNVLLAAPTPERIIAAGPVVTALATVGFGLWAGATEKVAACD